ncbi:hypothetical protein [Moraxella lacunata]|uniref:hypothetical protein n=1 Tax=Moraxella lacunata TaxID=477 RepID=UPI003EE11AD5
MLNKSNNQIQISTTIKNKLYYNKLVFYVIFYHGVTHACIHTTFTARSGTGRHSRPRPKLQPNQL